jgi:hypothetical protein
MSSKKVSYVSLLKEAIQEFDTSKNVDVKGPMLDPILSYDGNGELPTSKDAGSILERYYYNEENDSGISVSEIDKTHPNDIDEAPGKQDSDVKKIKDQIEDEVTEAELSGQANSMAQDAGSNDVPDVDMPDEDELDDLKEETEASTLENEIITKLIEEMEEEITEDEELIEGEFEGEGTEAAGKPKDKASDKVPDRKDDVDVNEMVDNMIEAEEEDLDVDKELEVDDTEEEDVNEVAPPLDAGPANPGTKNKEEEEDEEKELEEAFKIFKEEIE